MPFIMIPILTLGCAGSDDVGSDESNVESKTLGPVSPKVQERRIALSARAGKFTEAQAGNVLKAIDKPQKTGKTAVETLQDAIKDAQDEEAVSKIEDAFDKADAASKKCVDVGAALNEQSDKVLAQLLAAETLDEKKRIRDQLTPILKLTAALVEAHVSTSVDVKTLDACLCSASSFEAQMACAKKQGLLD